MLVVELDDQVLDRAGTMMPGSSLRSLDAIHLASAEVLGPSLTAVVTYDRRMIEAAEQLGLRVVTPEAPRSGKRKRPSGSTIRLPDPQ